MVAAVHVAPEKSSRAGTSRCPGIPRWIGVYCRQSVSGAVLGTLSDLAERSRRSGTPPVAGVSFPSVVCKLVAMNSPFDRFRAGDRNALTEQQRRGLDTFDEIGCDR